MKRFLIPLVILLSVFTLKAQINVPYNPEDESYAQSCTSIMVGKKASTDGSVMTAHSCDANYRTWLNIEPRKTFKKGDFEPVYWGVLHNEEPGDMRKVEEKGKIPAMVGETYRYLNVAYPCLNEKQLAIGETTFEGRKELVNDKGLFLVEELERIALQRTTTAREAIKLMGKLAETYGYGDWGECLTVADKSEVWHFEIVGSGEGKPSALWAAQRIPDDHVGVSANISRIGKIDFNDPNNFMYSSDLKERAKKLGYWDGTSPLVFHKVVSGRKPFSVREYYVLTTLAPSLNLSYESEELPFSVKPDEKVSPQKMFSLYRATYDHERFDQVKNLWVEVDRRERLADGTTREYKDTVYPISTYMNADTRALLNRLSPGITDRNRTIAVIQCSYSHVIQLRDWLPDEVGGVAYFSFDNPGQSPRIPIYAGATELPASFMICGQHRYRPDAAIWSFRETNRLATVYWDKTRKFLEPERASLEELLFEQAPGIEKKVELLVKEGKTAEAQKVLNEQTKNFASLAMQRWQELKEKMWMIFVRSM